MEVTKITETQRPQQKRFFCANCQREVFLQAEYCDKCGGEIEWPKEIRKVIGSWKKEENKAH